MDARLFDANVERFSGYAALYDRYRPEPPAVLADLLCRLAGVERPALVVDLGCGTGLSTRYWAERAEQVIGIDPSPDMLAQARRMSQAANVAYQEGISHATGLPDGCAQIVTCSQALHWMEPAGTFQEVRRILHAGGLFAAYDYDWPPATGSWQSDQAYEQCIQRTRELEMEHDSNRGVQHWKKQEHLGRMQASGCFCYTREIVLHHIEMGNAERLVGIALSQGGVESLLKRGLSEADLGVDRLRQTAESGLGAEPRPWLWSSRLRIGIVMK